MGRPRNNLAKGTVRARARSGIRAKASVLVLLIVLPLYALIVLNIRNEYVQDREDIFAEASRLTRVVAKTQSDLTGSFQPLLVAVSRLEEVRAADGAACSALFADLLKRSGQYLNIGAVTADGDVFCSAVPLTHPANVSGLAWFERTMATGRFSAGDFEVGKVTGVRSFSFGYPVLDDDGTVTGAVYASLDLGALEGVIGSAGLPAGTVVNEVDRNGTIIARYPAIEGLVGKRLPDEPVVRDVLGPLKEGTFTATGLDGVARLYAFAQVDPAADSSPYVIVGFDRTMLFQQLRRTLTFNILGLAAVTLIVLLMAYEGLKEVVIRRMEALEDVERLRNEFISLASHQLRTPITSVRWLLELLLGGKPSPLTPEQAELAAEAKRSADRLARLVKDLVEVEKGGLGADVATGPVDAAAVVASVIEGTRAVALKKKVDIEAALPEGIPPIKADAVLLREVVENLLVNALQYSPMHATVKVTLALRRRKVRLEVSDGGIGIPLREQRHVFERFYRASNARELKGEGLGLGLHLSKLFVERMGGMIGFVSKEGTGTTFWVEFPLAKDL